MGSQKQILVGGGAGFLGINLCRRLLAEGHGVLCLDNFYTSRRENLRHLLAQPGFRLLHHDVNAPLQSPADAIYNLACPASPVHYQRDPVYTTRTCVNGTLNLLALARANDAIFFQASTSEVYGDPQIHPQREDYQGRVSTTGPRACYDEGKRCAETLCFDHHRRHGVGVKVARIFNTYGPFMQVDDGRVVSNFIVQALTGRPITLHGDGSQTRSLCYVDDLIEALLLFMQTPRTCTGPINLGVPGEITMRELAGIILDLTGSRAPLVHKPLPQDDPLRRCPDIGLARSCLGWEPRVSLEQGLRRTIAYFEELLTGDALPCDLIN